MRAPHLDSGHPDAADPQPLEPHVVGAGGDADRALGAAAPVEREIGETDAAATHGHERPAARGGGDHGAGPGADEARPAAQLEVLHDVAPGREPHADVAPRQFAEDGAETGRRRHGQCAGVRRRR